jgi:hypothetical protein
LALIPLHSGIRLDEGAAEHINMKTLVTGIVLLILLSGLQAQTYNITSNSLWSTVHSGDCWTCTFNISTGVTLTLNTNNTCGTCTINGGTVNMTSSFGFQSVVFSGTTINLNGFKLTPNSGFVTFTNSIVNASGASLLNAVVPVNMTNSTFNFSGTSEFRNNGGTLTANSSHLYFYGNSFFNATAGPVNLNSNTQMVAGDGSKTSTAYLMFNGPTLNLVDAGSTLSVANVNNYYYNWATFNSLSNSKSYTTTNNSKNCGGTGQNACQAQFYYGCASFGSLGAVTCTTLASFLNNLKGIRSGENIKLSWSFSNDGENNQMVIERSTDKVHFAPLSIVNSSELQTEYSYTDQNPETTENFYRIRVINADGLISFSNIISVQNNLTTEIEVFPNPASGGHFFVQVNSVENTIISVYNMTGQLLYMGSFSGQLKYGLNLPHMNDMQYMVVHVSTAEKTASFNLLNLAH